MTKQPCEKLDIVKKNYFQFWDGDNYLDRDISGHALNHFFSALPSFLNQFGGYRVCINQHCNRRSPPYKERTGQ